ncbi:regulator of G-protein signaling 4-like [Clavelina lepadiformis]|uniref:regulator of G-protein signaling 4-like n=1 Tax=Clavelina lepadiformis TaxID=159417 RepID=UPI0040429B6E
MSRTTGFEEFLKKPSCLKSFRRFLQKEFSQENLDFWLAVEMYKNCTLKKQDKLGVVIYKTYIHEDAPNQVNLDADAMNETLQRLLQPDETTFDVAQKNIFELMERDPFRRYMADKTNCMKSNSFGLSFMADVKCIIIVFSYKLKLNIMVVLESTDRYNKNLYKN